MPPTVISIPVVNTTTITPETVVVPNETEIKQAASLGTRTDVPSNKTWTVSFNNPIDINTADASDMIIFDSKGKIVKVIVTVSNDHKSYTITPVTGTYTIGETYTLFIGKSIKSAGGTSLNNNYIMNFIVNK